jgi:hypothetical protein
MSGAWVDKVDNPGMANWELRSDDVYGAVVLVNFAAMAYRAAFTADFQQLQPVRDLEQLGDLGWLGQAHSTLIPAAARLWVPESGRRF